MKRNLKIYLMIGGSSLLILGWQAASSLANDLDGAAARAVTSDDDNWAQCIRKHLESRFYKAIDASSEQRLKLSELIDDSCEKNKPAREELKQKTLSLIDAFGSEDVSNDQLRDAVLGLRKAHEALMDKRLDEVLKARDLLTVKQRHAASDYVKGKVTRFLDRVGLGSS